MALSEQLIRDTYQKLKDKAKDYLLKGNIHKGELFTHLAAYTSYTFWLTYHDDEIEQLLKQMSSSVKKRSNVKIIAKRCVMLDSLARYRGGLTVQYVNAIMAAGWDLLYITEQEIKAPHHVDLYDYLKKIEKIKILEIPKGLKGCEKFQYIYDKILDFGAERVYLHSSSSNTLFPTICYALPQEMEKFYVDMADHGFRMGFNSCDYNFQFRSLGCSIATQFRGIDPEHILYLPFYPIIDETDFKGFPKECDGKVVVLSGGIFWKIVDQDDTFFKLCKQIIQQNQQTVIIYPGAGDSSYIQKKIKQYGIEDNFLLLGWRDDISELFRRCDIFLNTYPHGGATMSLYAANLHKPILSYVPNDQCSNPIEKVVCQKDNCTISSMGEKEFLTEAARLINDVDYREKKAEQIYNCIISESSFNKLFKDLSILHKNSIKFSINDTIESTTKLMQKSIAYHNDLGEYQTRIVALSGLNSITFRNEFIKPFIMKIIPKIKRVFDERGFHFNRL